MPRKKSAKSTFGTIEKRGENNYRIRWTDRDGVRRSETVRGPRFTAEDRLAEIRLGLYGGHRALTYDRYWNDVFWPAKAGLEPRTLSDYAYTWKAYLRPKIGASCITDTDWRYVQRMLDSMGCYSANHKSFTLWRMILNMAMRDRIITQNPVDRSIRLFAKPPSCKQIVEVGDIPHFIRMIRGIKYEAVLLCIIGGGLRPEEARSLRWEDISPLATKRGRYALVNVDKAIVMVDGRPHEKSCPKTSHSYREAVIGDPFARRILGLAESATGPICPGRDGRPTSPSTMDHNWKAWCARRGERFVTMEELRSSYATNVGESGVADSLARMQMGHAGKTVKETNYQQRTRRSLMLVADMYRDWIVETALENRGQTRDNSGTISGQSSQNESRDLRKHLS